MDKQDVVCTYNGRLFGLKREGNSDTFVACVTDDIQGHYGK
jgi:hypothetical protein